MTAVLDPDPAALRSVLGDGDADRNGVPEPGAGDRMAAARAAVEDVLGDLVVPGGIVASVLGDGWSSDLDVHVREWPDDGALMAAGWVPLDPVLAAVGSPGRGRWAVVAGGEVLAPVDLHLGPPAPQAERVLARCARRREVRLREVLELRELARRGDPLPDASPALAVAADAESALGGDGLRRWATGSTSASALPSSPAGAGLRRAAGRARRHLRPRLVVAVSGVDGSGKSTLARRLVDDLRRAGVPAELVWTRPGMGLRSLSALAAGAKRLLRHPPEPGVRAVAAGDRPASRRGAVGWLWSVAVTVAFVAGARRRHLAATGVVVHDRHLLDALVTLDFVYGGVDLRLQRALVRRLLPRAAVTFHLDVPAEVAVARKPGDTFGDHAVRRQLDGYAAHLPAPGVVVLDGTRPAADLAAEVLGRLPRLVAR